MRTIGPGRYEAYRRAFAFEPFNEGVCYRYRFILRQAGDTAEYDRVDRFYKNYKLARKADAPAVLGQRRRRLKNHLPRPRQASDRRGLYYEVLEVKTLGLKPHPELYQRLADLREKMGRFDEARAWHRLVLRDQPDDALSLAALGRLK